MAPVEKLHLLSFKVLKNGWDEGCIQEIHDYSLEAWFFVLKKL